MRDGKDNGETGTAPEWRMHILALQRPGQRPERQDRALSVRGDTHSAAAVAGVVRMLHESYAAGRPLEPGTRLQATLQAAGTEREYRLVLTYQPPKPAREEPAGSVPPLESDPPEKDYYVRIRSQQNGDGPEIPLEWTCNQHTAGPREAAEAAVQVLRAQMPGLNDPKGHETRYRVDTVLRGGQHRPFEGWEIEVTVTSHGTEASAPGRHLGGTVH